MNLQERIEKLSLEEQKNIEQIILGFENKKEEINEAIGNILNFKSKVLSDGTFEMDMPITNLTYNVYGVVHGGIIATLADEAIGYFVNGIIQEENKFAVTSDIHIRYLSPGIGEKLIATPMIIKKGNRMIIVHCEIKNEKGDLIAIATSNYYSSKKE